jgi:DDE superfamily endonuclease
MAHSIACGRIQELIRSGSELLYLPPYSPDLNKIEKCWSWLESRIRKKLSSVPRIILTFLLNCLFLLGFARFCQAVSAVSANVCSKLHKFICMISITKQAKLELIGLSSSHLYL